MRVRDDADDSRGLVRAHAHSKTPSIRPALNTRRFTSSNSTLKPERARRFAAEEPRRADAQAVLPRRQSRRVEREACLPRELARDDTALDEHGGIVRAEAHGLAQLLEVPGGGDAPIN